MNRNFMNRSRRRFLNNLTVAAGLLAAGILSDPNSATAGVFLSINIAPPALPVYVQPPCPQDGYLWTPGYWSYGDEGYFWVPGVWIAPPRVGVLWTPGYWGFGNGVYAFHEGYWGPHVGFYGGVNYGFGYGGFGFGGGAWQGGSFRYNTAVLNVNTTVIHNTYVDRTVINNTTVNRTSFNGGPGGVNAQPRPQELAAAREQHVPPTAGQLSHQTVASRDRAQLASVNHGAPATTAMNSPNGARFGAQGHPGAAASAQAERPHAEAARPGPANAAASHPTNNAPKPAQENRPAQPHANAERPAANHPAPHAAAPHPAAPHAAPRPAAPHPQAAKKEEHERR